MIIDFRTLIFRSKFNSHAKELQQLQLLLHDQGHVCNERPFLLELMLLLVQTILPWFLNASIITWHSSCQITSIRHFIFCQFSLTRFTCPLFSWRPSFPHIMVNSSSSAAASLRTGISTETALSSPCWDSLSTDSPSSRSSFPASRSSSPSSPELSDTSAKERAGTEEQHTL